MLKNYFTILLIGISMLILNSCKESTTEMNLVEVNVSDLKLLEEFKTDEVKNDTMFIKEQIVEFKRQKCKRRFPLNKFNFRIKGEGINIPVKNGSAVNVGDVELTTEIGAALTETVLVLDGYNEQMCQIRNIAGQIAMTCGQNDKFYKILNLQIKSNNALTSFFLAMKTIRTENDVKDEIEKLKEKINEIDKKMDEL